MTVEPEIIPVSTAVDPETAEPRKGRKPRVNGTAVAKVDDAPAPAPVSQGDAFAALFERLARDPTIDPARIHQFLQMKREEEDRQAERAYNAAMAAAQAELIPVARKQLNDQTKSKYADLAAIAKAALPIIHKHGFGIICSEFQSSKPDHLGIALKVTHAAGHSERHEFNIPYAGAGLRGNANMTPTHAYASTVSYGRRYAECCVFNIATADDDGNAAGGKTAEKITEQQVEELSARIQKTKAPAAYIQIIFEHFNVESLSDLTPKQFNEIGTQLKTKYGL